LEPLTASAAQPTHPFAVPADLFLDAPVGLSHRHPVVVGLHSHGVRIPLKPLRGNGGVYILVFDLVLIMMNAARRDP
jgi:hypothetical protein